MKPSEYEVVVREFVTRTWHLFFFFFSFFFPFFFSPWEVVSSVCSFTCVLEKKGTTVVLLYTAVLRVLEKKGTTAVLLYTAVPVSYTHLTLPTTPYV